MVGYEARAHHLPCVQLDLWTFVVCCFVQFRGTGIGRHGPLLSSLELLVADMSSAHRARVRTREVTLVLAFHMVKFRGRGCKTVGALSLSLSLSLPGPVPGLPSSRSEHHVTSSSLPLTHHVQEDKCSAGR